MAPQKYLALDTECTGGQFRRPLLQYDPPHKPFAHPPGPFLVTWCNHKGESGFIRWRVDIQTRKIHVHNSDLAKLARLIRQYPMIVFHNATFDLAALNSVGLDILELCRQLGVTIHDTLAGSHVLHSGESHKLKDLSIRYLDILDDDEKTLREKVAEARRRANELGLPRGPSVSQDYHLPYELLGDESDEFYGVRDAIRTALLFKFQQKELDKQKLSKHYLRELKIMLITYTQEQRGIPIRPRVLSRTIRDLSAKANTHLTQLQTIAREQGLPCFNPRSYKQLATFLYDDKYLALPVVTKTAKNQPSTDKGTLPILEGLTSLKTSDHYNPEGSKFLTQLLAYRDTNSSLDYLKTYARYRIRVYRQRKGMKTGFEWRLYPSVNPWATATTRFSMSEPTAHNVSKNSDTPARKSFGPTPDRMWLCYDYSQLELRIMAKSSGDPTLNAILDEGQDRHQITADALGIPRKQGKNVNFAWQYGAGSAKLAIMVGMDASTFALAMRQTYPLVIHFMEQTISVVRQHQRREGLSYVYTLFGYRLMVPRDEPYKGANYIVQGTAGDILKNAIIAVVEYLADEKLDDVYILLTVHDEIVVSAPEDLDEKHIWAIRDIMASQGDPIGCPTPVDVEYTTTSWQDTKPYTRRRKSRPAPNSLCRRK